MTSLDYIRYYKLLHFVYLNTMFLQKYRDYYEIIKHPIDLKVIAIKIQQNSYTSLGEMFSDVMLLVSNAKTFNEPGSQIYKVTVLFRPSCYVIKK